MFIASIFILSVTAGIDLKHTLQTVSPAPHHIELGDAALASNASADNAMGKTAPLKSQQAYIDNCAACHGEDGHGIKDQGASLATSQFVKSSSDSALADFIKTGRQPDAPDSTMKLLMPAFDYLTDEESEQVIAFIRAF